MSAETASFAAFGTFTLACVDATGSDILVGTKVIDSFGEEHTVAKIVPLTADQAYIEDEHGAAMMPWLTQVESA